MRTQAQSAAIRIVVAASIAMVVAEPVQAGCLIQGIIRHDIAALDCRDAQVYGPDSYTTR